MLEIAHNVKDRTNYVKSLVTSHNAAILEKVRDVSIYIPQSSAIFEKVRHVPIYFSRPSAILEKVRDVPIPLLL